MLQAFTVFVYKFIICSLLAFYFIPAMFITFIKTFMCWEWCTAKPSDLTSSNLPPDSNVTSYIDNIHVSKRIAKAQLNVVEMLHRLCLETEQLNVSGTWFQLYSIANSVYKCYMSSIVWTNRWLVNWVGSLLFSILNPLVDNYISSLNSWKLCRHLTAAYKWIWTV